MIPRCDGSPFLAVPPFSITCLHVEIASGKRLNLLCLVSTVRLTSVTILAKAKQNAIPYIAVSLQGEIARDGRRSNKNRCKSATNVTVPL